jgi:hypothetical protein
MSLMKFKKTIEFLAEVVRPGEPDDEGRELQVSEGQRLYGLYVDGRDIFLSSRSDEGMAPAMLLVLPNTEPEHIGLADIPTNVEPVADPAPVTTFVDDTSHDDDDGDTCSNCNNARDECTCVDGDDDDSDSDEDDEDSDEEYDRCAHCGRLESDCSCPMCANCGCKVIECICAPDEEDEDHEPDEGETEEPEEPEEAHDEEPPPQPELRAEVMEATLTVEKPIPPGWFTTGEICQGCDHPLNECICT